MAPKFLWHVALVAILLNLCLFAFQHVHAAWQKNDMPKSIRPIQISGGSEDAGKRGESLAHLLSGRLAKIDREMTAAHSSLDAAEKTPSNMVAAEGKEASIRPFGLPGEVVKPLDLKMSVGSVEVGGLLSWLHGWMAEDSALAISVAYTGEKSIAAGVLKGDPDEPLWVEGAANDDIQLVTDLAYAIAQNRYRQFHPEVEFLKPRDFGKLLGGLNSVATLSLQAKVSGVNESKYLEKYDLLEPLLRADLANWRPLVHVVAELAERSGQRDKALALYQHELGLLEHSSSGDAHSNLLAKIEMLEKLPGGGVDPAVAKVVSEPEIAAAQTSLRSLLGLPNEPLSGVSRVRIGIVGPPPGAGVLPEDVPVTVLSARTRGESDLALVSYMESLTTTIRLVMPDVEFVFADLNSHSGSFSDGDGLGALNALLGAEPLPAIILHPYSAKGRGPIPSGVFERISSQFGDDSLFVFAAGNDSRNGNFEKPFTEGSSLDPGAETRQRTAVAGAVDWDGKPADFSNRDAEVLWAPGVKIGRQNGTSVAAAIITGVAAWIKAVHPRITSRQIVEVLQKTSKPQADPNVKVVNLQAALDDLAARPD